jgi:hypothetical protein
MQQIYLALLLVLIFGTLATLIVPLWNARRSGTPIRKQLTRVLKLIHTDQIGGYVHDTAMSYWVPLSNITTTVGTWAIAAASNVWSLNHTPADNTSVLHIPLRLPQNSVAQKGSYLSSVDIFYTIGTADSDAITPVIQKITAPAHGGAVPTVSSPAFTYDSNHDTAAKRKANGATMHKMTLYLTTPPWMDDDDYYYVELTVDGAATSVEKIYGVRANFTLRI